MYSDCIRRVRISPIQAMAERTRQAIRGGRDVVDLTLGEPDFPTPEHVCQAAVRAISEQQTKYTPINGTVELREAIARKFRRENALDVALDEISVGCGAKQVIFQALMATLRPGDEVVIPAPYWASYEDIVAVHDGVLKPVSTRLEDGVLMRPEALERALTPRTRWLVLNSPSNPTGAAYTAAQLAELADVIQRSAQRDFWILTDDIYEHILYDGLPFTTIAQLAPSLRERTLTVNGVSKAYAMTGWRVGYAAGPKALIAAMTKLQMQINSHTSSVSQAAARAALDGPQELVHSSCERFRQRRDLLQPRLDAIPGLRCPSPQGAFYLFPSVAGLLGRRTPDGTVLDDDIAVANHLLDRGVSVVPGTAFGMPGHLRLSYATSEAALVEAASRIRAAAEALQ